VVLMNMFTYDQTDPEQGKRIHDLYYGLYREAKKRGYGMYRAHVNHMGMERTPGSKCLSVPELMLLLSDLIANLNDYNNHAYNKFVEKIKVRPMLPTLLYFERSYHMPFHVSDEAKS
jgi:predicted methyltransferase